MYKQQQGIQLCTSSRYTIPYKQQRIGYVSSSNITLYKQQQERESRNRGRGMWLYLYSAVAPQAIYHNVPLY